MKHCFQVDKSDNVSTLLDDAENETLEILGAGRSASLHVRGLVKMGHKVALCDMEAGTAIVKYGVPIGVATRDIVKGEWVHLQNCQSQVDLRSAAMDPHSGAATDTRYE
ncbi:MAG: UxaA family hydrolase [Candidatus Acidiferrales bacterium]